MLVTLKEFRQVAGLTKPEIANLLNISLSYYEKIESGERNPSYNFLKKFSRIFPDSDITSIFFSGKGHISCKEKACNEY